MRGRPVLVEERVLVPVDLVQDERARVAGALQDVEAQAAWLPPGGLGVLGEGGAEVVELAGFDPHVHDHDEHGLAASSVIGSGIATPDSRASRSSSERVRDGRGTPVRAEVRALRSSISPG